MDVLRNRLAALSGPWLVLALIAGLSVLALGPSAQAAHAQGDPVAYTAQWVTGPGANQQTLTIKNTGGYMISEFTFTTDDSGVQFVTINGSPSSCVAGSTQNQAWCGSSLDVNQTEKVVMTSQSPITQGATGKLVVYNDADSAQPAATETLTPACTPDDPQGPGQKDKCPDGEEKAKHLEVGILVYDAKTHKKLEKTVREGEEVYLWIGIQNPNDDPVEGKLHEHVYEELLPSHKHPVRDDGPGLLGCEVTYPVRKFGGSSHVDCDVELPAGGSTSFKTYMTVEKRPSRGPMNGAVDVKAHQISDGQNVSSGHGIARSVEH